RGVKPLGDRRLCACVAEEPAREVGGSRARKAKGTSATRQVDEPSRPRPYPRRRKIRRQQAWRAAESLVSCRWRRTHRDCARSIRFPGKLRLHVSLWVLGLLYPDRWRGLLELSAPCDGFRMVSCGSPADGEHREPLSVPVPVLHSAPSVHEDALEVVGIAGWR